MNKLAFLTTIILFLGISALAQDQDTKLPKNWQQKADTCWMANQTGDIYISIGTGKSSDLSQAKKDAFSKCRQLIQAKLDVSNAKMSFSIIDEDTLIDTEANQYVYKMAVKAKLSP